MSCYLRHMKGVLDDAGIELSPTNKKEIDRAFHQIVSVQYKDCPAAWKKLKQEVSAKGQRREDLIRKLREAMREQGPQARES